MWRRPVLEVRSGRTDTNILPGLTGLWLSVSVTLNEGEESDEAEIEFVGPPSRVALPKKGDRYQILMGWADEGLVDQGSYTVQKVSARGDPDSGERIVVTLRAAELDARAKAIGRKHYDKDETLGARLQKVAGEAGASAVVDPELAALKLPYALRLDQSPIDFAREQIEAQGGVLKVASGRWIATRRSEGKGGGGSALDAIEIKYRRNAAYDVEIDARGDYKACAGAYVDARTAKRKLVKAVLEAGDGPTYVLPHPHKSEAEARKAAEAWLKTQLASTGEGSFDQPGLPKARAGAQVQVSGFGAGIDGSWRAKRVHKIITADAGFKTTVSVDAGKESKGAKRRSAKEK